MERQAQRRLVERFFGGTGASYDRIVRWGTLGFDGWWKRRILAAVPAGSAVVVDQASGTGILTFRLARRLPAAAVVGVELRREYAAVAAARARALGLGRVSFVEGRAEEVAFRPGSVDCVTSSYLAKYAELGPLAANLAHMLRPGGRAVLHDFTRPRVPLFARGWEVHLRLLRALGSPRFPEWRPVFDELPGLLRQTTWVDDLPRALAGAGFGDVRVRSLTFGAAALVTATRLAR
ncbi:MAG: class I SAM-dependent methyltransferase [Deferrisomatales bacterium]